MIIYNVTTHLTHDIHDAWMQWMKHKHIPEIMSKECFVRFQFVRILDTDETEGITYAVQFYAEETELYDRYVELHAVALREDTMKSWGTKTIVFRSLMEVVD